MYTGHTPALCCAPDLRTADCLAMILSQMFPQSPNSTLFKTTFKGKATVIISRPLNSIASPLVGTLLTFGGLDELFNSESEKNYVNTL